MKVVCNVVGIFGPRVIKFDTVVKHLEQRKTIIIDKIVWVDDVHDVREAISVYSMINKIFFIYRKKSYREYSIINRDKISIESVDIMEIPYKHNYLPKVKGKKVERIYNNGTLEDLEKIMQNKYNKVIKEI